ncbi:MAG: rhomboid family intramembrane serine protease [Anaerolineae bacterium]|nr:rhomboid family intramembrane serine protease [Anaerolineae bacterium]
MIAPAIQEGLTVQVYLLIGWFALLWGLWLVDSLLPGLWLKERWGLRPRELNSLPAILTFSFLHGGSRHLWGNSTTLFFFAWLVMLTEQFWLVSLIVNMVGGVGIWLLGRGRTIHLGASGFIYGYWGYLIVYGMLNGSGRILLASLFLGWLYRYSVYGIWPNKYLPGNISWEGHLSGLVGGVVAAWLLR